MVHLTSVLWLCVSIAMWSYHCFEQTPCQPLVGSASTVNHRLFNIKVWHSLQRWCNYKNTKMYIFNIQSTKMYFYSAFFTGLCVKTNQIETGRLHRMNRRSEGRLSCWAPYYGVSVRSLLVVRKPASHPVSTVKLVALTCRRRHPGAVFPRKHLMDHPINVAGLREDGVRNNCLPELVRVYHNDRDRRKILKSSAFDGELWKIILMDWVKENFFSYEK